MKKAKLRGIAGIVLTIMLFNMLFVGLPVNAATDGSGMTFSSGFNNLYATDKALEAKPYTLEANITVPESYTDQFWGNIIAWHSKTVSNSGYIILDLRENRDVSPNRIGARILVGTYSSPGSCTAEVVAYFDGALTDFRGENVHLALTIDNSATKALTLYVNGDKYTGTTTYSSSGTGVASAAGLISLYDSIAASALPKGALGGDFRPRDAGSVYAVQRVDNFRWFRGAIYNVSAFSDLRTANEIKDDVNTLPTSADNLLLCYDTSELKNGAIPDKSGNGYNLKKNPFSDLEAPAGGKTFSPDTRYTATKPNTAVPKTFEATIYTDLSILDEGDYSGVIIGNYESEGAGKQAIIMDVASGGPRIFLHANGKGAGVMFKGTLVPYLGQKVHIAITIDPVNQVTTLYINGKKIRDAIDGNNQYDYEWGTNGSQKANFFNVYNLLTASALPYQTLGGDLRANNSRYFQGTIYSAAVFSDIRTVNEINSDMTAVPDDGDLIAWYDTSLSSLGDSSLIPDLGPNGYNLVDSDFVGNALSFSADVTYRQNKTMRAAPNTFEAWISLPEGFAGRGGVILGNYDNLSSALSFEITDNGKPRLYVEDRSPGSNVAYDFTFDNVNIATGHPEHLAIVRDGASVHCYVNSVLKQTKTASSNAFADLLLDHTTPLVFGGDLRPNNEQYFKGSIYSASVYSNTRSAAQIVADRLEVNTGDANLLAHYDASELMSVNHIPDLSFNDVWLVRSPFLEEGLTFSSDVTYVPDNIMAESPNTFEAWIRLTADDLSEDAEQNRGGVILGNYGNGASVTFEVVQNGAPRLYVTNADETEAHEIKFSNVNVATGKLLHLAIVRDVATAKAHCYVNGLLAETVNTNYAEEIKITSPLVLGGDWRDVGSKETTTFLNEQYFKGNIISTSLYKSARTAEQIKSDYISTSVSDDMILWYDIEDRMTDNVIVDKSQNGYSAVRSVPTEGGLVFTKDSIYSTNIDRSPKTFEAKICFAADTIGRGGVIFGNYGKGSPCFSFEINTGGKPRLYILDSDGTEYDINFNASVYTGEWLDLAVVVDAENSEARCYINGVLADTQAYNCPESLGVSMPVLLGGDLRYGNVQYFKGALESAAMFSDVRSADELVSDMNARPDDADLIAWYDISESSSLYGLEDLSGNGNDIARTVEWLNSVDEKTLGEDYAYSFAVIGDTQIINVNEAVNGKYEGYFEKIYDYVLDNKESKNIQFVFGLGDITDADTDAEWQLAKDQITRMNGIVPYSLVRGNHDTKAQFHSNFSAIPGVSGTYDGTMLNTYTELIVGNIRYLMLSLDYGASDGVLNWADGVIASYPNHNVIITTHAYLFRDGTTLDEGDVYPPSLTGGYNDGDDMWDKLIRKHENIVLVMSGHDPYDNIVMTQTEGDNGNIVTQMLIDPQGIDANVAPTGMVAMLYFSEDGRNVSVEWYSTIQEKYYRTDNCFDLTLDVIEAEIPDVNDGGEGGSSVMPDGGSNITGGESATSKPAQPSVVGTIVTYGVSRHYIVILPVDVTFDADFAISADVTANEVIIDYGEKLTVKISSENDWYMLDQTGDSENVAYTANLVQNEPTGETPILGNGDTVLTVLSGTAGLSDSATLYFDTDGTRQAGIYLDTLTFTVAIEKE